MDQLNGVERNTESQYTLQNAISSGHSSIYSQNLSRQISVASHGSSFKEQLDHVTLLKQFDANTQKQLNHDKDQPTTNSTNVQNSQVTLNTDGEQQRGNGDINVFNQNLSHINLVDNTVVPKIERVEYVLDIGQFGGYDDYEENMEVCNDDIVHHGVYDQLYNMNQRPKGTLDNIFEAKMQKRLATFHNKPIDRTQFDAELLQKQLDLETVNLELVN